MTTTRIRKTKRTNWKMEYSRLLKRLALSEEQGAAAETNYNQMRAQRDAARSEAQACQFRVLSELRALADCAGCATDEPLEMSIPKLKFILTAYSWAEKKSRHAKVKP